MSLDCRNHCICEGRDYSGSVACVYCVTVGSGLFYNFIKSKASVYSEYYGHLLNNFDCHTEMNSDKFRCVLRLSCMCKCELPKHFFFFRSSILLCERIAHMATIVFNDIESKSGCRDVTLISKVGYFCRALTLTPFIFTSPFGNLLT